MYEVKKSILGYSGFYGLRRTVMKVEDSGYGAFRILDHQEFDQCDTPTLSTNTPRCILSDSERAQIGSLYSSLRTEVVICATTASLKVKESKAGDDTWCTQGWGVPVLVLEKNVRPGANRLFIYLAELGTGMPLWKDLVTIKSRYVVKNSFFHKLYVSWNHNIQVGLQFTDSGSAYEFWLQTSSLLSFPQNNGVHHSESIISKLKRKLLKGRKLSDNLPAISVRAETFQHITHVETHDRLIYSSMQSLVGSVSEL